MNSSNDLFNITHKNALSIIKIKEGMQFYYNKERMAVYD
jgi:hypothetical protein